MIHVGKDELIRRQKKRRGREQWRTIAEVRRKVRVGRIEI